MIDGTKQTRMRAALKLFFVGDALAMPVHWYYRLSDIEDAFPGGIRGFETAPATHPSSLMSSHSTRAGGRAFLYRDQQLPEVVGDVILRGRARHWNLPNRHYHHGMQAGENTLNAHCARVLMRTLAKGHGTYHAANFLAEYVDFMTADPPRHPDTYAESFHRAFFANWLQGKPLDRCAERTHDTPSIGGLVMIAPLALLLLSMGHDVQDCQRICRQHLALTHPHEKLARASDDLVALIAALLWREPQATALDIVAEHARRSVGIDLPLMLAKVKRDEDFLGKLYSTACYIEGAWPGVLFLLYKYHQNSEQALLRNTNLGGDNVHRGAVLGLLLGLADAEPVDRLFEHLADADPLSKEIDALLTLTYRTASDPVPSQTDHHYSPSTHH